MSNHDNLSTPLPRWKFLLFSTLLVAVVAFTLEGAARLYLRVTAGYDGQHLLQYEFDPYKNLLPTRGFVDTRGLRHNTQGFRHPADVSRAKPGGTLRVFLMGASTAYGTGGLWTHIDPNFPILHDTTTIAHYLQLLLSSRIPDATIEVINAGIPSTWTHHHLIYLNQSILGYDPDAVVFVDGFNDYFMTDPDHDQFRSYAYKEHAHTIMGPPTAKSLVYGVIWWSSRKSAFIHVALRTVQDASRLLSARPERRPMDVARAFGHLQEVFPRNALKMVERTALILNHERVGSVFVLQPMLIMQGNRNGAPGIERSLYAFNVESYLPGYDQFMQLAVPYVSDRVRSAVTPLGAEFLDLTYAYEGVSGQIFTDYAHLTPQGNLILAQRVAETLEPLLLARSGAVNGSGGQ